MRRVSILICAGLMASAQTSFEELAKRFENANTRPSEESAVAVKGRPGVRLFEYSFASPVAGRVPGVLITPERPGRFPIILFGHWMMEGSPMKNHREFVEEAVVLSRAGAICLLLDTPLVRPGVEEDPDLMHGQEAVAAVQMVREWRRALDLLFARRDVDPQHVAYVGHSFNAGVGAKLTAVEKRIQSFVLMANTYSLHEFVYDDQNSELVEFRKKVGEPKIAAYLEKFSWDDSGPFVQHSAPSSVFLQNGRLDKSIPEAVVRKSFELFQQPKRLEFYDSGHELNSEARRDRVVWLQKRLDLEGVDFKALDAIPQLR